MTVNQLKSILEKARNQLQKAPNGTLSIIRCNNTIQYYCYENKTKKYLSKNDIEQIKALAQKYYNEKIVKVLVKQISCIDSFLAKRNINCLTDVYTNLPEVIKPLVEAYELPANEYAKQWEAVNYKRCTFNPDALIYKTDKGELVRSKTEVIIANRLFSLHIPYRYESELQLKNGAILFPDFIVLNKNEKKEFILEHFGMVDDEAYSSNLVKKISTYAENGYIQGKNLLCTYETSKIHFNIDVLNSLIREFIE